MTLALLFYGSLLTLGILAVVLGIVNIYRLKEIHALVNSNSAAQRQEIVAQREALALLNLRLADAIRERGIVEQQRDARQAPSEEDT